MVPCRSIDVKVINLVEEPGNTWMDLIINYLNTGTLPSDLDEARKVRIKSPQYSIIQGILYKKGYLTPRLRYVGTEQANYVLSEAHFGSCGANTGA